MHDSFARLICEGVEKDLLSHIKGREALHQGMRQHSFKFLGTFDDINTQLTFIDLHRSHM